MKWRAVPLLLAFALLTEGCGTAITSGIGHASAPSAASPRAAGTSNAAAPLYPNARPGELPPALTFAGRSHTPLGSLIFADYWIHTLDWAYATGDSTLARGTFVDCHGCAAS